MKLRLTSILTSLFTYNPNSDTLTADRSDFNDCHGVLSQKLYDDAEDVGFELVSHKTGQSVVYVHSHCEKDSEHDILWDDFTPIKGSVATTTKVRIFND